MERMQPVRIRCHLRSLRQWHALEVKTMLSPDPFERPERTRQEIRAELRFRKAMIDYSGGMAE